MQSSCQKRPSARALRAIQQPLPLPPVSVVPNFSGCTFTNCVFQLAAPIPVQDPPSVADISDVDLNDFLDF